MNLIIPQVNKKCECSQEK